MPARLLLHPLQNEQITAIQRHLAESFAEKFDDRVLLCNCPYDLNTKPNTYNALLRAVKQYQIKTVVVLVWLEPLNNTTVPNHIVRELMSMGAQVEYHGYCSNFFDFWAVAFANNLSTDLEDISITEQPRLYLSHARSPRAHRVELYQQFENLQLLDKGYASLGRNHTHDTGLTLPPFDVFSLGDLTVWNNHLITVVGEDADCGTFITEKTWKPIVGLRPFVVNGDRAIVAHLAAAGFDTFPELQTKPIAEMLKELSVNYATRELVERYNNDWLPRCIHNRQLYSQYVRNQKSSIESNK